MPNGYRGLGIAALAAALLIAFGLGAYWTGLPNPQQRYQSYQHSKADEGRALSTVANVATTVVERTPCNKPKSETESDLCAQWRAAKAAEKSAEWTVYGFWATLAGMALLTWQIILTREAVKDTGDATLAMQAANDHEFRAWLDFELTHVDLTITDQVICIPHITIKNLGRSPATFVTCIPAIKLHGVSFKLPNLNDEMERQTRVFDEIPGKQSNTIFPGKEAQMQYPAECINLDALKVYQANSNPSIWVTLAVRVSYYTFNKIRWTDHYFKIGGFTVIPHLYLPGLDSRNSTHTIAVNPQSGGMVT
ncbi:MAG: hypothetical protein ABI668_04995 [Sphingorhabdus sp.]